MTPVDGSAHISLRNVSLQVPTFVQKERNARGWASMLLGAAFDPPRRELRTLLKDLTFDVREGERLAILGRNGAGKSTLLRVMNQVFVPTRGEVVTSGSRQALLNMSLGFNGEATVRENIFLRGTAMGLQSRDLRDMIDPIVEFAGLANKLNHRLRTLSAGQKMRLGFAISTSVQHDIILMDEWVGAGDADFMRRAKERMQGRMSGSKIVVLASHSLGLLRDVCNRAIVLDRGRLVFNGSITDGLAHYQALMARPEVVPTEDDALDEGGAAPAMTSGAVERVALQDGLLRVEGWALRDFSAVPRLLGVELQGVRHVVEAIEWLPRKDVQEHFGLLDPRCGFRVEVPAAGLDSLAALGGRLAVSGGDSEAELGNAFRLAPQVNRALDENASAR